MESKKRRTTRCDSFELSDSDQLTAMDLRSVIFELQTYFPSEAFEFTEIDKWIAESKQADDNENEDFQAVPLYNKKFVANVRKNMRCVEVLRNIRSFLEESSSNAEITNWDLLVKAGFKVQCYHTFIYTLMRLLDISCDDKINRDLAFNAGTVQLSLLAQQRWQRLSKYFLCRSSIFLSPCTARSETLSYMGGGSGLNLF